MVFGSGIILKSSREIDIMEKAGRVVAGAFEKLRDVIRPGLKTRDIDGLVYEHITGEGAVCTFKGYRGYPYNTCVSVNEQVVHGFPSDRILEEGEIVSIDIGATLNGYVGDSAVTFPVGKIDDESARLLRVTRESLYRALDVCVPGNYIRDVGVAVEQRAREDGFSVVRDFVGHGIGRSMHERPEVPNFATHKKNALMEPGLVIAIEPMVNAGTWKVRVLDDKWTVVTADGSLSAHFEHTVAVTGDGPRVLTRRDGEEEETF